MSYPPSGSKDWDEDEVLTESDLEGEFTHTRSLLIPENIDDFSSNATEYRYTTTPDSSNLPVALNHEIRHLRGGLKALYGRTNWDDIPDYILSPWVTVGTNGEYASLAAAITASKTHVRFVSNISVTSETDWTLSNGIIDGNGYSMLVTDSNPITGSILQISGDENVVVNLTLENNDTTGTTTNGLEIDGDKNRGIGLFIFQNGAGGTLTNGLKNTGSSNEVDAIVEDKAGTITNIEA